MKNGEKISFTIGIRGVSVRRVQQILKEYLDTDQELFAGENPC